MIDIENISKIKNPFSDNQVQKVLVNLIHQENRNFAAISILYTDDEYLLEINKKFLNHNYYTDIITFNFNKDKDINGELIISLERVKENAKKYNENFNVELLRVLIHGVLHLCGYNDKGNLEKTVMRFKENIYLNNFVSRETLKSVK